MTTERRRALLVEDSPTQAERLRAFLESEGLEVIHMDSAEAALEKLNSVTVDLIVLDYHLPGMDGHDFCREIRMNLNTRAIPVLMLTVEGGSDAELLALDRGADDYLSKTADPDVLRMRLQALLRKSRAPIPIVDVEKRFSRARILAIDDSPTYLYRLSIELKSEHYIVDTVQSAAEGLRMARSNPYDCILVDFDISGADGAQVCSEIRAMQSDSGLGTALVILTSHEDKEHMTRGFVAGADDYIPKSVDASILKARVRALLRRKFLVDENQHIFNELKEKELETLRAKAEKESAELRALVADKLAEANRELEQANRKLDLANRELEHFAYAAAHDRQEPLRMVGIYSQLLQRRYRDTLDTTGKQFVDNCVEGAQRMDRLIRDLLEYARATQGADEAIEPVDCNTILDTALANLQGAIEESGATIVRGSLPALRIVEIQMQQLLQNLVGNAIKYRRAGQAPRVRIAAERRDKEWLFLVEDNGIGIEPEQRRKIFGAFKRAHNNAYSGTGLGLAICKRIVEHHGGNIWVEAAPDGGSTFFFTLPRRLEASVKAAES